MFHPIKKINLTYRNLQRLKGIVVIFMRHGLYGLMEMVHLHLLIPLHKRIRKKKISEKKAVLSLPERLRLAFEELGPTFIKLGQLIASRPDLVPEDMYEEFKKLHDEVPPFPYEEVKRMVEAEFKAPISDLFSEFDKKPIAAASIAQIHGAVLSDGTPVAVKVQRPHVERIINSDIELMYLMAKLIARYIPETKIYNPVGIVDEFSRGIKKEIDFVLEASNMIRVSRNFKGDERVVIPNVYWDCTTSRVLTLDRVEGTKIDDLEGLSERGIDCKNVARLLSDIFFTQVFKFGLFHGDLHAGNIFVVDEERIGLVDFGIVGRISDNMVERLANIFMGIVKGDYKLVLDSYLEMGIVPEKTDFDALERDFRELLETFMARPLKESRLGELLVNYSKLSMEYEIKLPTDLITLDKCILELEGLILQLAPDLDILETSERYAGELLKIWLSPKKMTRELLDTAHDIDKTARILPGQIRQLMKKMINDKFTIDFVHVGLENLVDEIDRSSNRISLGLIISALIIGSSLIFMTGGGPQFMGFPILGFVGFVLAAVLGFFLAVVIIRSRKF